MPSPEKLKLVVLASGRGTNLQALIDAFNDDDKNVEIVLVLSDNRDAKALARATEHGIATCVVERKNFGSRGEFDDALADAVQKSGAKLVALAGFMRILSGRFLSKFKGWVINIHPALLPSFPGLDAQQQALEHGVKITGATVHFVDEGVDTGPIILQAALPVEDNDTVETLSTRILELEHCIYPEAITLLASGKIRPPAQRKVGSR